MAPFKKWGQRKIQICRFRQAENERERERGRGEKEERAGLWEETRVCRQGLRLSVCWGLSSEVDDALGEQLRCRAFRLHHYCSPSSSSSKDARTHTRTRPCNTHRSTCAALINMQQRRRKKEISDCCISALASARLWSGFACLAGQRNRTKSESHMVMVNLAACTVVLKPLWKQSDEKSWKKKKKTLKPAWWLIFNALLHVGRIWWKRAETEADEIGGGGRLTYWAKWHRWSPRATAPTVFTLIWVKWISHCRLCLKASRGCLNAAWQSIKPRTLMSISSETGRCYFHRPYLAPHRICTTRAASAE